MQIDEEVRAALETLRRHAEGNEIELHRIDVLERALMAPLVVEQVNYINLADNAPTNLVALTKSEHQRVNHSVEEIYVECLKCGKIFTGSILIMKLI